MTFRHWLAHLFLLNDNVVTRWDDRGHIWLALQCLDCGKFTKRHRMHSPLCPCYDSVAKD